MAVAFTSITNASTSQPKQLLDLPTHLQVEVARHLQIQEKMALRLTNRHFSTVVPSISLNDLLTAEVKGNYLGEARLACSYCVRLRNKGAFDDDMKSRDYTRGGRKSNSRFCMECGMSPPAGKQGYVHGAAVHSHGSKDYFCSVCKTLQSCRTELMCMNCRLNIVESAKVRINNCDVHTLSAMANLSLGLFKNGTLDAMDTIRFMMFNFASIPLPDSMGGALSLADAQNPGGDLTMSETSSGMPTKLEKQDHGKKKKTISKSRQHQVLPISSSSSDSDLDDTLKSSMKPTKESISACMKAAMAGRKYFPREDILTAALHKLEAIKRRDGAGRQNK